MGLLLSLFVGGCSHSSDCSNRCKSVIEHADSLAAQGNIRAALEAIDGVDADCDCMRFTEGDEPPEHSTVRVLLERLRKTEGDTSVAQVTATARGRILRDFR